MTATFTLTGTFLHQDNTTPIVGSGIHVKAAPYPDPAIKVYYTRGVNTSTDANGKVSISLVTEPGLYYTIRSTAKTPLFNAITFAAPSSGTIVDISSLTTYVPGDPPSLTVMQGYMNAALAAVASVAYSTWQATTAYALGQTVQAPDGSLIKATSSRTSRSSFDATEQTFWTVVGDTASTLEQASLQKKIAQVSVLEARFGAKGDGTTDDTAAIHAARDSGASVVMFPPGTYKTTSGLTASVANQTWVLAAGATINGPSSTHTVTVSSSGVTLMGQGRINNVSLSSKACVYIMAGLTDIEVLGLEIATSSYGVQVKSATGSVTSRVRVSGCHIHDTSAHGVFFNWETTDSEVSGCTIHDTGANGNGVWMGNSSHRNRVIGNAITNPGRMGIESYGGNNECVIADNTILTPGTIGISLDTNTGTRVIGNSVNDPASYGLELAASNKCIVQANYVLLPTIGISISAPSGTCDDNLIQGNTVIQSSSNGIFGGGTVGPNRIRVIGNTVVDAGNGAGSVSAIGATGGIGSTDWSIVGNTVRFTTGNSGTSGINPNMPNCTIEDNTLIYDSGLAAAGGTAINLPSACINNHVSGNTILGNAKLNKGIVLNSAVTGCLVSDNFITGTQQNMIDATSVANSNVISNNHGSFTAGGDFAMGSANGVGNKSTAHSYLYHAGNHQFGTSGSNLGFYGITPIAQQTRPGQLTIAAGTPSTTTTVDVGTSFNQTTLNNIVATLAAKINALETVDHNIGLTT